MTHNDHSEIVYIKMRDVKVACQKLVWCQCLNSVKCFTCICIFSGRGTSPWPGAVFPEHPHFSPQIHCYHKGFLAHCPRLPPAKKAKMDLIRCKMHCMDWIDGAKTGYRQAANQWVTLLTGNDFLCHAWCTDYGYCGAGKALKVSPAGRAVSGALCGTQILGAALGSIATGSISSFYPGEC